MTELAGDQTRGDSTAFFRGDQSVRMSQNEVAALCLKAARGAGMTWGMAEEAGFAASWLTARGLDGPRLLLAHLTVAQGRVWADLCPQVAPGNWAAPKGKSLCPIALGATLCDYAALAAGLGAAPIKVGPVDQPLLVLPFLGSIAGASACTVTMAWDGGTIEVDPAGRLTPDALAPLDGKIGVTLHLSLRHRQGARAGQCEPAPAIAAQTIAGLNAFALRTTVPASDASRAGAGASSSDND